MWDHSGQNVLARTVGACLMVWLLLPSRATTTQTSFRLCLNLVVVPRTTRTPPCEKEYKGIWLRRSTSPCRPWGILSNLEATPVLFKRPLLSYFERRLGKSGGGKTENCSILESSPRHLFFFDVFCLLMLTLSLKFKVQSSSPGCVRKCANPWAVRWVDWYLYRILNAPILVPLVPISIVTQRVFRSKATQKCYQSRHLTSVTVCSILLEWGGNWEY